MTTKEIKSILDRYYLRFNTLQFIALDPILIPHRYTQLQDIEIAGFFAAILAWGQRVTIINKCSLLLDLMDNAPYEFIQQHEEVDLKRFLTFSHRTFNATDTLYFISFLKQYYQKNLSLENAFVKYILPTAPTIEKGLIGFQEDFFSLDYAPQRTQKHIASPAKNSTCKRLNMYLRWMVRADKNGVDFGLWKHQSTRYLRN
jgi:uncharacterized protein (TIGR02757 family)